MKKVLLFSIFLFFQYGFSQTTLDKNDAIFKGVKIENLQDDIFKKIEIDLRKIAEDFRLNKIEVDENFFVRRIIHMEVFRFSCGEFEGFEAGVYELHIKNKLAEKFKDKPDGY